MTRFKWHFLPFLALLSFCMAFPEPGRFTLKVDSNQEYNGVVKNVYNGTKIYVKIRCSSLNEDPSQKPNVMIGWVLRETRCWNEYALIDPSITIFKTYYDKPDFILDLPGYGNNTNYIKKPETQHLCDNVMTLPLAVQPNLYQGNYFWIFVSL